MRRAGERVTVPYGGNRASGVVAGWWLKGSQMHLIVNLDHGRGTVVVSSRQVRKRQAKA